MLIGALLIHAVYLLNCACDVAEIREKTLASLREPGSHARRRA